MLWYSVSLLLIVCFTSIKAPQYPDDPERTAVKRKEFTDWGCGSICNDDNKARVKDWCVKLSGTQDPNEEQYIRNNSDCIEKQLQLISGTTGQPAYYDEEVGFCDMGADQSDKKCITKSKGNDDILVWNREGEGIYTYCVPAYEKTGWFAKDEDK